MPARERNPVILSLGALNLCFLSFNRGVGFILLEGFESPFLQVDSDEAILATLWTINADGDAVASVIAVGRLLEHLKKRYYMVLHDAEINKRINFMPWPSCH